MYVSMNPKGKTGKVIHISQNDTNREVEFIPYDQNGLVKTTSDEIVAHINSIKGNTVSFNQLVQNGNFADTSNWTTDGTFTVSNNVATVTTTASWQGFNRSSVNIIQGHKYYLKVDVKKNTASDEIGLYFNGSAFTNSTIFVPNNTDWNTITFMGVANTSLTNNNRPALDNRTASTVYNVRRYMFFDLTLMGIDNLTTTVEVEEWLSSHIGDLPYYDYTQGTLIPFNGTGLKTVGKNLADIVLATGQTGTIDFSVNTYTLTSAEYGSGFFFNAKLKKGQQYRLSFNLTSGQIGNVRLYDDLSASNLLQAFYNTVNTGSFSNTITPSEDGYLRFWIVGTDVFENLQLERGSSQTSYEPYQSNTLSLPTLTYFPTGMKSAGSVYDELSDKAYKRIESVDLGSLTWNRASTNTSEKYRFSSNTIAYDTKPPVNSDTKANIICAVYPTISANETYYLTSGISVHANGSIFIYDSSKDTMSADDFKSSLSGQYIYYEYLTPTETDISLDLTYPVWDGGTEQILPINDSTPDTTPIKANITYPDRTEDTEFLYKQTFFEWIYKSWAFVCKNITQVLSAVGNALKGTIPGTMTSESGKFPLKLKMTDNDGVCFSEKIDLFVERKP